MTEETQKNTETYEIKISFIQPERAMVRISATSEEMALAGLREMTEGVVRDLKVESITKIAEDAPIPDEYDPVDNPPSDYDDVPSDSEPDKVVPMKKTVH